jgi:hypothetical protein
MPQVTARFPYDEHTAGSNRMIMDKKGKKEKKTGKKIKSHFWHIFKKCHSLRFC